MIGIDDLIEDLDENAQTLEIRRDSFINSIIENYTISQFLDLSTEFPFDSWDSIEHYYINILLPKVKDIHTEYGQLIIDYFFENVKQKYHLTNYVEYNISDDYGVEFSEVDEDDIIENDDYNKLFSDEINYIHLKNCIVNGGALHNWDKMFLEIKNDLDLLDLEIYNTTKEFITYSLLLAYKQIPIKAKSLIAGYEEVNIQSTKAVISVKGINYIVVCHEILKGLYDLMAQKTFPVHLDEYSQKYIRKITSSLYHEKWEWLFSRKMYELHIDQAPHEESLYKFLLKIFNMQYISLTKFLIEF